MTELPIDENTPRILIVEDEPKLGQLLIDYLRAASYAPSLISHGDLVLPYVRQTPPHLILMDLMLPGTDGVTLCREIRRFSEVPIVMVTAKIEEIDRLLGLEIGADDYITKPFNPRELTIRARNLLSRTMNLGTVSEERRSVESYKFNGWELDINSRSLVSPNGEQYKLPRSEFRAMLHFCENPGKIQSRAELLKKMTGRELKPHDRTVDVTIRRIRKHFESTPDTPEIIATIHGEGYRFCGDLQE